MQEIGKLLIVAGAVLLLFGAVFLVGAKLGWGRLPGDFVFRRGNATCIVPLATSLLLSLLLTLIFWFLRR